MTDYIRWQKSSLEEALAARRVVMLTGARQCGKATLARTLVSDSVSYRTLDDQAVRQAAESDPHLFVERVSDDGTLIIDEAQNLHTQSTCDLTHSKFKRALLLVLIRLGFCQHRGSVPVSLDGRRRNLCRGAFPVWRICP